MRHNKLYMKVTWIYTGWFFPIEKAVKTILLGEFVFIVAFLSNFFVDDIEMVRRFWVLFRTFTFLGTKHFLLMVSYLSFYLASSGKCLVSLLSFIINCNYILQFWNRLLICQPHLQRLFNEMISKNKPFFSRYVD